MQRVRPDAVGSFLRLSHTHRRVEAWLGRAGDAPPLDETDLEDLTRPWRTLLGVVGAGVELSKAGWMPADVVGELCAALPVEPYLAGKANRESAIKPISAFRKVAVQVGLLHVQHGRLMPTVRGIGLRDDPAGLWAHIASRMPVGRRDIAKDAGWFSLSALAGGVDRRAIYDEVHELLLDAGWTVDGRAISPGHVPALVWPTLDCLLGSRRMDIAQPPQWLAAAAAAVALVKEPASDGGR